MTMAAGGLLGFFAPLRVSASAAALGLELPLVDPSRSSTAPASPDQAQLILHDSARPSAWALQWPPA
jgi:hypothetical protein